MGFAHKINNQQGVYFITCMVVQWVDVFTRKRYADVIIDSLRYCIANKGLKVFGWVIMSNHLHLLVSSKDGTELSATLRDFKKYTSGQVVKAIENNLGESRRSWLLWLLKKEDVITFWQPGNHPEEILSEEFFLQKLNYIYQNPVRAGIVDREEDYVYSSARDYHDVKGLLEISYFQ